MFCVVRIFGDCFSSIHHVQLQFYFFFCFFSRSASFAGTFPEQWRDGRSRVTDYYQLQLLPVHRTPCLSSPRVGFRPSLHSSNIHRLFLTHTQPCFPRWKAEKKTHMARVEPRSSRVVSFRRYLHHQGRPVLHNIKTTVSDSTTQSIHTQLSHAPARCRGRA